MASVKKGTMTAATERWKHLKYLKKDFWKAERAAYKGVIRKEAMA